MSAAFLEVNMLSGPDDLQLGTHGEMASVTKNRKSKNRKKRMWKYELLNHRCLKAGAVHK
jgi:hypothetical protein